MFTISLILKKHFDINVFNFEKIKNFFKTKNIRKKLSKDEKYLEEITLKTFDGSNYTTHPYILKLNKPLNSHIYYMSHTPYDNHNIELENPSLCVSNDGKNFITPKGIKDPLLTIIKKEQKGKGKYYSDSFMLCEKEQLQIWYRYTEENKTSKIPELKNQLYRITTKDGINFSEPELMIDDNGIWYLSPSIVKIKNLYYLYYFDKDLKTYVKTSENLKKWSKPHPVIIDNLTGNCWHGEVKIFEDTLYLLLLTKDYKLYLCRANLDNPLNFISHEQLNFNYYDRCNIYGHTHPYKSTFLIENGYIDLYIPFAVNTINYFKIHGVKHIKWTMTYTHIKLDRLSSIFNQI